MVAGTLLQGKVAIVTGGGGGGDGGIGRGICLAFAEQGAAVAVVDADAALAQTTAAQVQARGGRAQAIVADVTDAAQVEQMVRRVLDAYGRVDSLVNNVGDTLRIRRDFVETGPDDWDVLYRVNLLHVFLCSRAVTPHMLKQGQGGSIINISTVEAYRGMPQAAPYTAFKAAITQFTKSFALEVASQGIRVNAIAPDMINRRASEDDHWLPREQRHMIPAWVPRGRMGLPSDVAGVAVFLASGLAQFVVGATVHVDGGTLAAGGWYRTGSGGWTNRPQQP